MQTDAIGYDRYFYLYKGPGTGEVSKMCAERSIKLYLGSRSNQVIPIEDPSYFQRLVNAGAIGFPGGSAVEIDSALNNTRDNILNVMKKYKTAILGFCAGSYLMSPFSYNGDDFSRLLTHEFNHLVKRELVGPAYPLKGSPNLSTARAVPVQIAGDSQPFYVWWNGGGYYKNYDPSTDDILCTYHEPRTGKSIAALATTVFDSRVVLSNVHAETRMTSEEVEKYCPNMDHKAEYLASSSFQEALFNKICRAANILKT